MCQDQFHPNKAQNGHQTIFEVVEPVDHMGKEKVHRAKAQYGEYVRTEHQKGIRGYCQYGRNTVQGEQDIGKFNDHQGDEQGGGRGNMAQFDEKLLTLHMGGNGHDLSQIPIDK